MTHPVNTTLIGDVLPTVKARFCTEELKVKPMIDYILEREEHLIIVQGIRAEESKARASMRQNCSYFQFYLEPYGHTKDGKPKYHTYRKKEVLAWRKYWSDDVVRPVFSWTAQDVMSFIIGKGYKPNELYYQGHSRVGCFPCVLSNQKQAALALSDPWTYEKIQGLEEQLGRSFFSPDFIPQRFHTGRDPKSGKSYPTIEDVHRYVSADEDQTDLFQSPEGPSCMSYYNLCE